MCEVDAQEVIIWWFIYCRAVLLFAVVCFISRLQWTTADSAASEEHCNFSLYLDAGKHVYISENCYSLQWINRLSIVEGNRDRLSYFSAWLTFPVYRGQSLQFREEWLVSPWFTDSYFGSFHLTYNKLQEETNQYFHLMKIKLIILTYKDVFLNHCIDLVVVINDSLWSGKWYKKNCISEAY